MKNIRLDFPFLRTKDSFIYFDNAATTHKPQAVLDAMNSFYAYSNAQVHRGVYRAQEHATQLYEDARAKVAHFIGARSASEIVFTRGTTDGINCVAATWAAHNLCKGDEILITQMEHHSNLLPWQRLAQEKGIVLKYIPVTDNGTLDLSTLSTVLTPLTKLVAVTQVSNALGTINDVATIIDSAHAVGAKVLVDAAQSIAHQRINVQKMDPDFVVFSGHKMFGPTGVGVLYSRQELHDNFPPYQVGGGMVHHADFTTASWLNMPHRLEAGTPPIAEVIGLAAAIEYMHNSIDYTWLQQHEAQMTALLIDALAAIPSIRLLGPIHQLRTHGHMLSFVVDGMHAHDVAAYLDQHGICVRAGHHCAQPLAGVLQYDASVRVSFSCYNTLEEVEVLIAAIKKLFC